MAVVPRLAERIETIRVRTELASTVGYVTVAMRARAHDPLAVALGGPLQSMIYWEQPEAGMAIAAHGAVVAIEELDGAERFEQVAEQVRELRSRTSQMAGDAADRTALLIGGFSFFHDESWPGFPTSRLVLPELAFIQRGDRHMWVAAAQVDGSTDSAGLAADLEARLTAADDRSWRLPETPERIIGGVDLRDETYVKAVAHAVSTIKETSTQKIVVARQFVVDHSADLAGCLEALRRRFSSCVTFAVGSSDGVFCGATPERLVRVDGIAVETAAVAGTAPRGSDAMGDQVIADRLLHDPKEQEEHGYVVSEITRRLTEGGCVVGDPEATRVMQLPGSNTSTPRSQPPRRSAPTSSTWLVRCTRRQPSAGCRTPTPWSGFAGMSRWSVAGTPRRSATAISRATGSSAWRCGRRSSRTTRPGCSPVPESSRRRRRSESSKRRA